MDRFNGVTVNLPSQVSAETSTQEFSSLLKASVSQWTQEGVSAVWIQVPLSYSHLIQPAAEQGFTFHNAEKDHCLLKAWLHDRPDPTPQFATHQLGVCGVVLRADTQEVLVVQELKSQFTMWKFPGGLADLGEDIGDAAVRETFEETGIKTEFASIIAVRQQHEHPNAFGRSDLYVVCRLLPLTFDIAHCEREIARCQWMPIEELRNHIQTSSITHRITSILLHGLKNGFHTVDYTAERMKSVYKGQMFHIYHAPLPVDRK